MWVCTSLWDGRAGGAIATGATATTGRGKSGAVRRGRTTAGSRPPTVGTAPMSTCLTNPRSTFVPVLIALLAGARLVMHVITRARHLFFKQT